MQEKAPQDYEKFHQHRRKLIRAYEVLLLTGNQMTKLQQTWKTAECRRDARSFVLEWDNAVLRERISRRCSEMLASGWIDEAERFIREGLHDSPTAWQVLGYRQIAEYLNGRLRRDELHDRITTATWQFARRQNTWFRTRKRNGFRCRNLPPWKSLWKIFSKKPLRHDSAGGKATFR